MGEALLLKADPECQCFLSYFPIRDLLAENSLGRLEVLF